MKTRSISFIDKEDSIEDEVNRALGKSMEENLLDYFSAISSQCAMMGIDPLNPKNTRTINYIDNE